MVFFFTLFFCFCFGCVWTDCRMDYVQGSSKEGGGKAAKKNKESERASKKKRKRQEEMKKRRSNGYRVVNNGNACLIGRSDFFS